MIEQPKKRAWFQIHLSTAVVLMFVAGEVMMLNFVAIDHKQLWSGPNNVQFVTVQNGYGWPIPFTGSWSAASHTSRSCCAA